MANEIKTPDEFSGLPPWIAKMRQAARAAISEEDVQQIVKNQIEKAKAGDPGAIRFVFDQVLGGGGLKGATFIQNVRVTEPECQDGIPRPLPTYTAPRNPFK